MTPYTYEHYRIGDKLPIAYREANPYDEFVRGTSIKDAIQLLFTWQILAYTIITGVVVFSILLKYSARKKKR